MILEKKFLKGRSVFLEPLEQVHKMPLFDASNDDRIWDYHSEGHDSANRFEKWFDKAIAGQQSGASLVFVVKLAEENQIIGSTRYYDTSESHKRLTIGFTWYNPAYWGSKINPECKLLLLSNAFERCNVNRVSFEVDSRNGRSLKALEKLGAQKEGVLRKHIVLGDGYIRDTVVFSIIDDEWLAIKESLEERLSR